jgi:hypothetical protein
MNAPQGPLTGFGQGYICVSLLNSRNRPQSISFETVLCHYLTRRTLGLPKEQARFAVTWPFVMGVCVRTGHRAAKTAGRMRRAGEFGGVVPSMGELRSGAGGSAQTPRAAAGRDERSRKNRSQADQRRSWP